MTVHFIGAGPGAPDLLTLRGRDLIASCPVCLYAGSLVPLAVLAHCPPGAKIVNTAPMDLDAIMAEIASAHATGQDVARLHSGDLSVWSAMGEQLRRLRAMGVPFTVTPGVPSFAAAAAALGAELTLPGLAQSVVLTRTPGRASAMPEGESLRNFAATGATLALHLSIQNLDTVVAELTPDYGADCPVAVVYRASWPDQQIIRGTLGDIAGRVGPGIARTALIIVGRALAGEGFDDSRLYAGDYDRRYRPQGADSPWQGWMPEAEGSTDAAPAAAADRAISPAPIHTNRRGSASGDDAGKDPQPAPAVSGASRKVPPAPGTTTDPGPQANTKAFHSDTRPESDRPDE